MLRIENLSVHYGMIQAVHDVSFEVNQGEIVSLIGANGAGKTTILRTISGLIRPSKGTILFEGKPIQKEAPQKIVANGLSQVPEGRHVFPGLSVQENLEMGAFFAKRQSSQRGLSAGLHEISCPKRTTKSRCFNVIRRRTADVGNGTCTDVQASVAFTR